jgi:hypothetical protein
MQIGRASGTPDNAFITTPSALAERTVQYQNCVISTSGGHGSRTHCHNNSANYTGHSYSRQLNVRNFLTVYASRKIIIISKNARHSVTNKSKLHHHTLPVIKLSFVSWCWLKLARTSGQHLRTTVGANACA